MKENKNTKKYLIVILIVLAIALIGITSAAFMSGLIGDTSIDSSVSVEGSTGVVFSQEGDLNLKGTSSNFGVGNNISSTMKVLATLDMSREYTDTYYVYLRVDSNTFKYTTEENLPELILTIKDLSGNNITSLGGLEYVTVGSVSGFDVTEYKGTTLISGPVDITTDGTTKAVDEYVITLTLISLDTNQLANTGAVFGASSEFRKDETDVTRAISNAVLSDNGGVDAIVANGTPDFSTIEGTGMYKTEDLYGDTYYFRGSVDNNWVYFGGFYWRILRINGDGSVRIIYTGETAPTEEEKVVMTGDATNTVMSYFNVPSDNASLVGYMYTYGQQRGLTTDSRVKQALDAWYEENLLDYESYIHDNAFCYDRTSYSDVVGTTNYWAAKSNIYYGPYIRLATNKTPSLFCSNKDDYYTTKGSIEGNEALINPIALMSADEASYAGLKASTSNKSNYLYTNSSHWLGSPYQFYAIYAYVFYANSSLSYRTPFGTEGARAVISLDSNIEVAGTGLYNDPYRLDY